MWVDSSWRLITEAMERAGLRKVSRNCSCRQFAFRHLLYSKVDSIIDFCKRDDFGGKSCFAKCAFNDLFP